MSDGLDPNLEARLSRLAPQLAGADWPDVRRRGSAAAPRVRRRLLAALVAATLALAAAVPALGLDDRLLDLLGVTQTDEDVPTSAGAGPLPYVYGDTLHGFGSPRRLAAPLLPRFVGEGPAIAVPSPDGRYLAYHTADRVGPTLRVLDLRTGSDRVLARGAQMVAWGRRGIAYFQADPPEYRERFAYAGRVVVRSTPDAAPVTWVEGVGVYEIFAWAGPRLVIESRGCNLPVREDDAGSPGPFCLSQLAPGPYVLDGPGRARFLGDHRVAAVSPDGRYGFGPLQQPLQDSPTPLAHVVDLATGERVAKLDLRRTRRGREVQLYGSGGGAWTGDTIAVVASVAETRLVVLRYRTGRLTVERALRLEREFFPGTFGPTFSTPVFADRAGRRVVVRVSAEYRDTAEYRGIRAFLTCDLETRRCRAGRPLRDRLSLSVVFNPSRP